MFPKDGELVTLFTPFVSTFCQEAIQGNIEFPPYWGLRNNDQLQIIQFIIII